MRKKILVIAICIVICLVALLLYWQTADRPVSEQVPPRIYQPSTALSPQETFALLEHFNTAIAAREAKLQSGIIDFSLTLSRPKTPFSKNPVYEERVKWHVTYRFSGQQRFYQIQERVKVKPGWFQRAKWKESKRYRFQEDGNQRHGRVNRGDGWQSTSRHPIEFGYYNSPLHWNWDTNLTRMTQMFGHIVDAQNIVVDAEPINYLKFEDWLAEKIETTELWFNPQKDYRTTKVLKQTRHINKDVAHQTLLSSGEPITEEWFSHQMVQIHYTCQLAQFEPGIWYPQTTTEVLKVVDSENASVHMGQKLMLQVHSATFNIPIAAKDLLLLPDR